MLKLVGVFLYVADHALEILVATAILILIFR